MSRQRDSVRIANKNAYGYVRDKAQFIGSNMYATWFNSWDDDEHGLYVVFSYGEHFPMYAYDSKTNLWVANNEKYSRSTTRHQSQARPYSIDREFNTRQMQELVSRRSLLEVLAS